MLHFFIFFVPAFCQLIDKYLAAIVVKYVKYIDRSAWCFLVGVSGSILIGLGGLGAES